MLETDMAFCNTTLLIESVKINNDRCCFVY